MLELTWLFVASFLAATLLPAQSELILVGLAARGEHGLASLLATASVGNTLGSVLNWLLGWHLLRFRDRRWFPVKGASYERARSWFMKYGVWTLLLAWAPIVGDALTVVAGALRVSLSVFLALVVVGKTVRYVVLIALSQPFL